MGAPATARTFGELLLERAAQAPDALAYRFLQQDVSAAAELTRAALVEEALRAAAALQDLVAPGGRVLLLCATGLPYVVAFHACLLAGAIAVPAYPPRGNRHAQRVMQIVRDCRPDCVITDADHHGTLVQTFAEAEAAGAPAVPLVAIEALRAAPARPPRVATDPGEPAFLQYTSGSTGAPKGVRVSHANILANLAGISEKFEVDPSYRTVFWLPPYHDMGLVGGILHPVYGGYAVTLMSPFLFVQSPIRWLAAISQQQATASAAPNFGYQTCVDRITAAQCEGLDLRSWKIAICGGERVMKPTMDAFARKFAEFGFDAAALYPTYGMAEATLLMTGGHKGDGCRALATLPAAAGSGTATDVVSCGEPMAGHTLRIVDPDSGLACADGEVGEVWYAGPSVAAGYWGRDDHAFGATLSGVEGRFLRSGDLGMLADGALYILGRTKEMIIVRGANFYPADIEHAVADAHPAIDGTAVAAFAGQHHGVEGVVITAEVRREARRAPPEQIRAAITRALVEAMDIRPIDVVLLRPSSMLRTSSGKIRRTEMAALHAAGALPSLDRDAPAGR